MAISIALEPVVTAPGTSRVAAESVILQYLHIKVTSGDSAGRMASWEAVIPPRLGPPEHIHEREDEWFFVLEGEITFLVNGKKVVSKAGTSVFGPRGVPHTFSNLTETPARMLGMVTPGGFEEYFVAADRIAAEEAITGVHPAMDVFKGLMDQFGVRVVGPPLAERE